MHPQPLLLAAALHDPAPAPDPARLRDAARTAERAGLDLVTVEAGPADPLLVAARLAAQTARIGIVPVTSATTTEPFHVSTALATIDVVSQGRAGWVVAVDRPDDVRGTVTWEVPDDVEGDAREHVEAVRALWDSWEDGAVIRDTTTDRFLDRSRVHHVHLRGEHLAVRGPSITPRPPQGHPVVLVRAAAGATGGLAAAVADLVLVDGSDLVADLVLADDPDRTGGGPGDPIGPAGGGAGGPGPTGGDPPAADPARDPQGATAPADGPSCLVELRVGPGDVAGLADRLAALHAGGWAGAVLHAEDLVGTLEVVVPALEAAGLRRPASVPAPPTLRERLGLPAAPNRFAVAR